MEYTEITLTVPKGYEEQVRQFAQRKIDSILSVLILSPSEEKRVEYEEATRFTKLQNSIKIMNPLADN